MARYSFWGRAVDTFGNVKPNTDIAVYLDGTLTPATIYEDQVGGIGVSTIPQDTTDNIGRFHFWLDDNDYNLTQLFEIVVGGLRYPNVDIFRSAQIDSATISAAVEDAVAAEIASVSGASDEADNRLYETLQIQIESIESPSGNIINRANEYTDIQILSVSASSVEQDNRLWEQISGVSAASIEQDNRLLQLITVSGGTGIYSQYEKFAIEMEMEFKAAQSSYFKELTYLGSGPLIGSLVDIDIFTDNTKSIQLFHKDLYYNLSNNLGKTLLTRIADDSQVVKFLTYDVEDKLINIEVSAYNANEYSQFPGGGAGDGITDHGDLTGLADNDHPQYASGSDFKSHLASGSVHYLQSEIVFSDIGVSAHGHPQYDAHTDVAGVSAASREQDNRVREFAEGLESPSGNIINRANEYTDVLRVDVEDVDGQLATHLASGSVHFLESDIDFNNIGISAHKHPEYDAQANLGPISAASVEQDNRVREFAEGLESPSGNIINRANEYTDQEVHYGFSNLTLPTSASQDDLTYEIHNLTLPTSASIEDLDDIRYDLNTFTSPNSASQDDLTYEIHNLTLPTSASIEDLNDIRYDLNTFTSPNSASQNDLTYEIHNLTLPTSASIEDLDDIRYDLNTFTSPNSASQDDLTYEIHQLTLPTSASQDDLTYEIHNLTLPTSASIEDLDDIRYDLNTFTSPNSASQDDLTYEIHNLTLPTSASQEDILSVSGASREQDNRISARLQSHFASGGVHFELSNDVSIDRDSTVAISERVFDLHTLQLSAGIDFNTLHTQFYQSTLHEIFNAYVKPNGNGSSLVVSADGGGSVLTAFFQDGHTELTIPASGLSIRLDPGSRTVPKANFVYIDGTTKELTLQSGGDSWPQIELTKIAYLYLLDDAHTVSAGALVNQNWNDELNDTNGHLSHITENIRLTMGGSHWHSGVAPTINITANGSEADNVDVSTTSGVAYQMHRHLLSAQDTSTGSAVCIVNDSTTPYKPITDLNNLLIDATGASMTDRYFNLVIWGVGNKSGQFSPLLVNLPGGSYLVEENAINDVDGYDVYDLPHAFNQDSSTGFLIARFTFKHSSATFGTWTLENTSDLRGLTPGTIAGAGGIGQTITEFTDTQFKILDDGDTSKTFQFEASGISTSTNRILTIQDSDGTIALIADLDVLQNDINTFSSPNSASQDDILSVSAASVEGDRILRDYIDTVHVISVSAASDEKDQRVREYADDNITYEIHNLTLPVSASLEDIDDLRGRILSHGTSASVHYLIAEGANITFDYDSGSNTYTINGASPTAGASVEYVDDKIKSVSAASLEADRDLQDDLTYEIHNLTLPTSASTEDINDVRGRILSHNTSASVHFLESDIDIGNIGISAHAHPQYDAQANLGPVSAASREQDQRVREYADNNITFEIHNLTLPTSASIFDLNDIRYDLNTFSSPNSASQDDLTFEIHNLSLPTSASQSDILSVSGASDEGDNRLQEQIDLIDTSSISAASKEADNRHAESDGSSHSFIDQDVTITGTPTFGTVDASTNFTVGGTVITDGVITDTGTFVINGIAGVYIRANSEEGIRVNYNSGVGLYYDGDINLVGSATGVTIYDPGTATNFSFSFADDDLYLIAPDKFVLRLATKDQIIAEPNGAVTLGYDGFDTLLTRRGGITLRNTDNDDTEIFTGQDVVNLGDLVLYSPNSITLSGNVPQLNDIRYDLNTFTSPNSASQDDLTYEIHNLTLPTSASTEDIDDVRGRIFTHGASATVHFLESDIELGNIGASAHAHPRYTDQGHTHPASEIADDRIIDGDNIVRVRDTDNVIMVSAGGQTVAHFSTDNVKFKSGGTQTLATTAGGIIVSRGDKLVMSALDTQIDFYENGNKVFSTDEQGGITIYDPTDDTLQGRMIMAGGDMFIDHEEIDGHLYLRTINTVGSSVNGVLLNGDSTGFNGSVILYAWDEANGALATFWTYRDGSTSSGYVLQGINGQDDWYTAWIDNGHPTGGYDADMWIRSSDRPYILRMDEALGQARIMRTVNPSGGWKWHHKTNRNKFGRPLADHTVLTSEYTGIQIHDKYENYANVILHPDAGHLNEMIVGGPTTTRFNISASEGLYINNQLVVSPSASQLIGQEDLASGITSAAIVFVSEQADDNYTISTELINSIDNPPSIYSSIIIKKGLDEFRILFSGSLDSDNYKLDWALLR